MYKYKTQAGVRDLAVNVANLPYDHQLSVCILITSNVQMFCTVKEAIMWHLKQQWAF